MAWAYVIRSSDRKMFKCCRRAWDLGSRSRQNYEPLQPTQAFDFDKAMHEALALYYFPGMWEWNREVVIPMVLEGFIRSMQEQRDRCLRRRALSAEEEQAWNEHLEIGESILVHYSEWAPATDRFEPIRVAPDFEVNIPDPTLPGQDLVAPGSTPVVPIRYRGRFDALAMDGHDAYWIIEHRIGEAFADLDLLLLDEQSVTACWAWQIFCTGRQFKSRKNASNNKATSFSVARKLLEAKMNLNRQADKLRSKCLRLPLPSCGCIPIRCGRTALAAIIGSPARRCMRVPMQRRFSQRPIGRGVTTSSNQGGWADLRGQWIGERFRRNSRRKSDYIGAVSNHGRGWLLDTRTIVCGHLRRLYRARRRCVRRASRRTLRVETYRPCHRHANARCQQGEPTRRMDLLRWSMAFRQRQSGTVPRVLC